MDGPVCCSSRSCELSTANSTGGQPPVEGGSGFLLHFVVQPGLEARGPHGDETSVTQNATWDEPSLCVQPAYQQESADDQHVNYHATHNLPHQESSAFRTTEKQAITYLDVPLFYDDRIPQSSQVRQPGALSFRGAGGLRGSPQSTTTTLIMADFINNSINQSSLLDSIVFGDPASQEFDFFDVDSIFDFTTPSNSDPIPESTAAGPSIPAPQGSPFIQEQEIRPCLDADPFGFWSPLTTPPTSNPIPASLPGSFSPTEFGDLSLFPLAASPPPNPFLPTLELSLPHPDDFLPFISPTTAVSPTFDHSSPESSSSETVTGSPQFTRKRRFSEREEEELVEQAAKRLATSTEDCPGPVSITFQASAQPAVEATTSTSSKLAIPKGPAAACKCKFGPGGNQKPQRHWRNACPYNPDRGAVKFPCEECSQAFGRKDNLQRHVANFHKKPTTE